MIIAMEHYMLNNMFLGSRGTSKLIFFTQKQKNPYQILGI